MIQTAIRFWKSRVFLLACLAWLPVGLFVLFPMPFKNALKQVSYTVAPVALMAGDLDHVGDGAAVIRIKGYKLRQCQFLELQAFSELPGGFLDDAVVLTRLNGPTDGKSKPLGKWDLGLWQIAPIYKETASVHVFVRHDCEGYKVQTEIADVSLQLGDVPGFRNEVIKWLIW